MPFLVNAFFAHLREVFKKRMYRKTGKIVLLFNSSDGRVVRASASGTVDLGLISSRVKPMTLKMMFIVHSFGA